MKALTLFTLILILASGPDLLGAKDAQSIPVINSSAGDRRNMSLVVYSRNLALVREQRMIKKVSGTFLLQFGDVAEQVIPTSVVVESGGQLKVLEQQYEYDLLSVSKLLEKYVGKEITLERPDKRTNTPERVSGILLSLNGGRIIKFGDRVEVDPEGRFILPEVPGNFVTRPTLTWLVNSDKSGDCLVDVSYLTTGIDWTCEYLLELDSKSATASLRAWVSINNKSGAEFADVKLHLVAGELNRIPQPGIPRDEMLMVRAAGPQLAAKNVGESFQQEEAFEYYRYSLGRVTSLPNLQIKQIELFNLQGLKPERIYRLEGGRNFYYGPVSGTPGEEQVTVYLEWTNGGGNYPGMPLPAGIVRIYEKGPEGVTYFSGEDRIGHTPAERKISLKAGKAFDLAAERKQTEYKKLSDRLRQVSLEIKLTNRKNEEVTVQVDETLPGDWKITSSSHPYEALDSGRVRFTPRVRAGGETVVRYTVQIL
ncbi:MAG TPA: DUF4139 domain-containing protein [archaeon]|nr:DUF4139 domain-containing protein [archaeon]